MPLSNNNSLGGFLTDAIMEETFRVLAERISNIVGTSWSFMIAIGLVLLWAITGPLFGFSDTWQLVINTGTTIITFLMVFLIQNTQNREAVSVQLKLDELLCAMQGARTEMVNLDTLSDADLARLKKEFERLGKENGSDSLMSMDAEMTSRRRVHRSDKKASSAVSAESTTEVKVSRATSSSDRKEP